MSSFSVFNIESVKTNVNDEFGCLCICCSIEEDSNKFRQEIIKHGNKCGFEKVEIIDESTAIYFNVLSGTCYKPNINDLIFIIHNQNCFIWLKKESEAEMLKVVEEKDFKNLDTMVSGLVQDEKLNIDLYILLHEMNVDMENSVFKTLEADFKYFSYTFEGLSKGALTKALIMANDSFTEIPDAITTLQRTFEIFVGKKRVLFFQIYQKLPLQESIELKKYKTSRQLYVISYSTNKVKMIDEAIFLPANERFLLTFKVDKNGIFNIYLKKLDLINVNYHEQPKIYYSKFAPKPFNLVFQKKLIQDKTLMDYKEVTANEVVGIDLGTTKCFAAVVRQSGVETFALDNTGERSLASYVAFDEKDAKCGNVVIQRFRNHAKSTVIDSKRIIGKEFNEIKSDKTWPFKIVNHNNYVQIEVEDCGKKALKYPEEIFAILLKHIKQQAVEFQGKELEEVVISCPVSFTKSQKDATYISALLAGWKKVHLVTDSMAALVSYFNNQSINKNTVLLVFDLGGGNLDVSVVEVGETNHLIMHLQGITDVGGRDFDNILFKHFKDLLSTKFDILVEKGTKYEDKIYRLLSECELIKIILSSVKDTTLPVDIFDPSSNDFITITSEEFEALSADLLNKIRKMIIENLDCYECNVGRIDKVLQLGGGCRMPMIQKLIKETFQNADVLADINPDEMVALGAVHYAKLIANIEENT